MSFLTDLFEGNTSNLGHDLTSHFGKDLLTAGEIGGGLALGGLGLGALGGAGIFGAETGAATAGALGGADAFAGATAAGEAGGALGAGAGGLAAGSLDTLAATGGLSDTLASGAADPLAFNSLDAQAAPLGSLSGSVPGASAPAATGASSFAAPSGLGGATDPTALNAINAQAGPANGLAGGADSFSGATASGTSGPTSGGFLDSFSNALSPANLGKDLGTSLGKNLPGVAIGGAGLAYAMSQGQKTSAATQQIQQQAAALNAQGQQLASYLTSGNLPPGLKTQLDQATSSAKAQVISTFAKQGMSTDPSQNSALAQELALIDQQAVISTATIGQNLLTTGISETGMASQLYTTLSNIDQTQTAAIGKAIASMAAAFSPGGTKIQIGGTTG